MTVNIKICGITNKADAEAAIAAGADMLGFIFCAGSARNVEATAVGTIVDGLPSSIEKVGVFVDSAIDEVAQVCKEASLTVVQLHGSESPEFVSELTEKLPEIKIIKAVRVKDESSLQELGDYKVWAILLDTHSDLLHGGTGESFDWGLVEGLSENYKIILAGGLNEDNVVEAIRRVRPFAVDVSSGVEASPGKKDVEKINNFVRCVREYEKTAR